jgi:type I restriction-modification system DNA methylase subunit
LGQAAEFGLHDAPLGFPLLRFARPEVLGDATVAQNKIQDPAKLRKLVVDLIGNESWCEMSADVKGDAYEGLLERNAEDTKSGAGQYFTPRALIDALVDCIRPRPGEVIAHPACGTGGFLLSGHTYVANHHNLDQDRKRHLRYDALRGIELVDAVARLCAMNLFLHGIGPDDARRRPPIKVGRRRSAMSGLYGVASLLIGHFQFTKLRQQSYST